MLAFGQKLASTSVHMSSLYKCLVLIFKRYGVNKHNLLTTSYFFDKSGCGLSEKISSFKTCGFCGQ